MPNKPENRVVATLIAWALAGCCAGLVWLQSLDPLFGLRLDHPVTLVLFGICAAVGLGFTLYIWTRPNFD